jgi:hypothetical protein
LFSKCINISLKPSVSENLTDSLMNQITIYKRALKIYLNLGYIFGVLMLLLCLFAFNLSIKISVFSQIIIYLYIIVILLLSQPYINWRFGKDLLLLEQQLNSLKKGI